MQLFSRLTLLMLSSFILQHGNAAPSIPPTPRDYRAVWCATVSNIDWPPVTGVSASVVTQQKNRLIQHLDTMVDANMNAMYLQVRPACDAMYDSNIEPWSQWLTGSQFTPTTYDPLAFAVEEAHKRGIELHAWVNPYRASVGLATWNKASNHVTKARPDLCIPHGNNIYMDPGKEDSITWITDVIADMVTRYDIDGVVFDDYFYPGPTFNDGDTYAAYVNGGGTMDIDNWRRDNVDRLIEQCYNTIHDIRESCQFSVGPFGVWRPGYPEDVTASDYYATHYCDTRKWLQNGWVDSLSPQLYWPMDSPGQPFGSLIDWWAQQNPSRHVMASTADYRIGNSAYDTYGNVWSDKTAQEIVGQVNRTHQGGGVGNVHYSMKWLTFDHMGVHTALKNGPYADDALRPASTWLDNTAPPAPIADIGPAHGTPARHTITFSQSPGDEKAVWWCVNTYDGSEWSLKVLPGVATSYDADAPVEEFAVSAVDRSGNESVRITRTSVRDWSIY